MMIYLAGSNHNGPSEPDPASIDISIRSDIDPGSDRLTKSRRSNQLKLQESVPKFLTVEVVSSKTKASITVDGTTVSYFILFLFFLFDIFIYKLQSYYKNKLFCQLSERRWELLKNVIFGDESNLCPHVGTVV